MRLTIVCIDTRGGVQPYLGLGLGLQRAGHDVCIAAPAGFRALVESTGLPFAGIPGHAEDMMQLPEVKAAIEKGFIATHRLMIEKAGAMIRDQLLALLEVCDGSDAIVVGIGGMLSGEAVAEKLGVPVIQAQLQPLTPTTAYPGILSLPGLGWLGPANWLSHALSRQVFWQPLRRLLNAARRDVLGLPRARFWGNLGRLGRPTELVLHGYSPALLPRPSSWPAGIQVTGYWFLDQASEWSPPSALVDFIEAGPAPLAIGFGSMGSRDAASTTRLILDAVEQVGQRVVLISGWGGLGESPLPAWAHAVSSVPHDWLFPRCAAVVHHGGAGTTAAAIRAGVPSVVVPFSADQPFWARLVMRHRLGVSAGSRTRLTAKRLARGLTQVLEQRDLREAAHAMGRQVRAEDGVGNAVAAINAWASNRLSAMPRA